MLILGRFFDERKPVLDAIRDELRKLDHIRRYPWVIKGAHEYEDEEEVIASIKENIIGPAEAKVKELRKAS